MSAMTMACPEHSTSQHSSRFSGPFILSAFSFMQFPETWMMRIWYRWFTHSWALRYFCLTFWPVISIYSNYCKMKLPWPKFRVPHMGMQKYKYLECCLMVCLFSMTITLSSYPYGLFPLAMGFWSYLKYQVHNPSCRAGLISRASCWLYPQSLYHYWIISQTLPAGQSCNTQSSVEQLLALCKLDSMGEISWSFPSWFLYFFNRKWVFFFLTVWSFYLSWWTTTKSTCTLKTKQTKSYHLLIFQ